MDWDAALKGEIGSYEAKEWTGKINGQEVTLYAKPLTPADQAKIRRKFPDFPRTFDASVQVEFIAIKATDAEGNKVFGPKHVPLLNRLSSTLIAEMFAALFSDQLADEDEDAFEERVGN